MSLIVVGSVAFDSIENPFGKVERELGGSATYFSIAASFFHPVSLVAIVGEDFEDVHTDTIKRFGVDISGLEKSYGKTFFWEGKYSENLNERRTIKTELNVFENFKPLLPDSYRDGKYLFLANIDPDLQLNVLNQVKDPKIIACDTMNLWISTKLDRLKELLRKIHVLIINDSEARELSGEYHIIKAGKIIQRFGPKIVIIKRGEYGSLTLSENSTFVLPGFPVMEFIDPTGAGDSFAGGFMGHLAKSGEVSDKNLREAVVWGSVMGSFCVEEFGINRYKRLKWSEIENRFKRYKEWTQF